MHPILVLTYVINLIIINYTFGFLGFAAGIIIPGAAYFLVSKNGGDKRKYIGQVLAFVLGHVFGLVAIANAPWGSPIITIVAGILETLLIIIFIGLGKA